MEKRAVWKITVQIQGQIEFGLSLFNFEGPLEKKGLQAREIWGYSSAGRAPALQAGGQRFDPAYLHHRFGKLNNRIRLRFAKANQIHGLVAQVVRAHA